MIKLREHAATRPATNDRKRRDWASPKPSGSGKQGTYMRLILWCACNVRQTPFRRRKKHHDNGAAGHTAAPENKNRKVRGGPNREREQQGKKKKPNDSDVTCLRTLLRLSVTEGASKTSSVLSLAHQDMSVVMISVWDLTRVSAVTSMVW